MVVFDWLINVFRENAELAFFLALSGGYFVGRLKFGGQPIGAVLGVLLVGLLVGQIGITIADDVKWVLFYLFLFVIGFKCGPQFVHGLRTSGAVQVALTFVFFAAALLGVYACSLLFGFDAGTGAGLFSGALTASAALGVAGDMVARLPMAEEQRHLLQTNMTSAFAASYFIGVIITTWYLSRIGPWLIRSNLAKDCKALETELGVVDADDLSVSAYHDIEVRGYRIPATFQPLTVADLEAMFSFGRVFVERVISNNSICEISPTLLLQPGDLVSISGREDILVRAENPLRDEEVSDRALLDLPTQTISVTVTTKEYANKQIGEISKEARSRGVFLIKHMRTGMPLPRSLELTIQPGDVLTLTGSARAVHDVAEHIGRATGASTATDMAIVSATIVLGALVGVPAWRAGNIEVGLSISVGILIGGLVLGWWYSTRQTTSRIPEPVLWFFDSVGLAGFVAVTALNAGQNVVTSIQQSGVALLVGSLAVTVLPHTITLLVGRYIMKVHPGILLGISAGAGTSAPGLAAVQDAAQSKIPTLGYGVTYAIGSILLALGGSIIVSLLLP